MSDTASRQDAAWWTDPGGDSWVADLEQDGRVITIRCVGVMKIVAREMWLPNGDTGSVVRYAVDLEGSGFATDADLDSVGADGSPWEWENNSWFELFENDQSIGVIAHTFDDAVDLAKRELDKDLLDGELRTCDGCGVLEDAGGPDQDGLGRSECCSDVTRCVVCSAEVSWRDCDVHPDDECCATECDTPFGCGRVARDCEDREVVAA